MRFTFKRIAPLLALGLAPVFAMQAHHAAAQAPTAPAPAPEPTPLEQANAESETYGRYLAQARACGGNSPSMDAVMAVTYRQNLDLLAIPDPAALIGIKSTDYAALPCDGAQSRQIMNAASVTVWQALTRLKAMHELSAAKGWSERLAAIDPAVVSGAETMRGEVEQLLVRAYGQDAISANIAELRREAESVFLLSCEPRKTLRSTAPRACPALPQLPANQRAIAKVRIDQAEALSARLAKTLTRELRGEVGQPFRLPDGARDPRQRCSEGDVVIYPQARDTKPGRFKEHFIVSLHRHGEAATIGSATIQPMSNGTIDLIESVQLDARPTDMVRRAFVPCQLD